MSKENWNFCQFFEEYIIPGISPNPDFHCDICSFECERKNITEVLKR